MFRLTKVTHLLTLDTYVSVEITKMLKHGADAAL